MMLKHPLKYQWQVKPERLIKIIKWLWRQHQTNQSYVRRCKHHPMGRFKLQSILKVHSVTAFPYIQSGLLVQHIFQLCWNFPYTLSQTNQQSLSNQHGPQSNTFVRHCMENTQTSRKTHCTNTHLLTYTRSGLVLLSYMLEREAFWETPVGSSELPLDEIEEGEIVNSASGIVRFVWVFDAHVFVLETFVLLLHHAAALSHADHLCIPGEDVGVVLKETDEQFSNGEFVLWCVARNHLPWLEVMQLVDIRVRAEVLWVVFLQGYHDRGFAPTLEVVDTHQHDGIAWQGALRGIVDLPCRCPFLHSHDERTYPVIHLRVSTKEMSVSDSHFIIYAEVAVASTECITELQYGHTCIDKLYITKTEDCREDNLQILQVSFSSVQLIGLATRTND